MDNIGSKICIIAIITGIFLVGWLSHAAYNENTDIPSPYNHIKKDQIHVYDDRIVIDLQGANWAEFTDTNSMDPIIDIQANSFEIEPRSPEEIHVGDIISYYRNSELIIHRVIETGQDNQGWYSIVQGDNLTQPDPGKIRFNQIQGVVVGIIY